MSASILRLDNIEKSFGERPILKGISFEVKKGEILVILGSSGCGKSTLLRTINGLENINQGQIYFHEQAVHEKKNDLTSLRQKIGMVFQNYELFPHLNVLENLILAPVKVQKRKREAVIREAENLLERVGLLDYKKHFIRQLSGGQKQRVAIIRAILMNPEILLFDEVTASLDPEMVKEVLDLMTDLAQEERTMIIVTHELSFAREVADRIIFMDQGKVLEEDTTEQFFTKTKSERVRKFLSTFHYTAPSYQ
ncbi:amino acid ABC transporter ATP-binding protein [Streptococcus sciuri]|uniref:Amino acid ABC transporter ATP-binding protein n=1 Tax=Streptococcus sciuri TaxID=2973939 RepID=A0ABT2F7Y4_9STRE|nr:amino acid ABC transporter ATP-binding protein [Streptococcus sciuri]MCS4488524.1 amino acid ABC transporter ATP-binding protein [Streptococcus sciuri]